MHERHHRDPDEKHLACRVCQRLPDALTYRRTLAPLPGCGSSRVTNPVVSLRSTTGYRLGSLRDQQDQGIELARVIAKNKVER